MSAKNTSGTSEHEQFDFFSDEFQQRPHEHYAALREACPVAHNGQPHDWYALTRETDVREALRNYRLWTSHRGPGLAYSEGGVLVNVDPPQHTSDRRLVSTAFAPADLMAMEPSIRRLVDEEIDGFVGRGEGDLMEMLATPLPLIVIAWILGLDPDYCRQIRPRADGVVSPHAGGAPSAASSRPAEIAYFKQTIGDRRQMIADGAALPDDTLTALITADLDGRVLTDEEILGFMMFLFIAGSQTTTLLIGNLVFRLLQHPDQMELVRNDRRLVPAAVEESLRYDAPVHGLFRTNTEDVELHGVTIPTNTKVMCSFFSANMDPQAWDHPERFDVTRDLDTVKKHYSFGKGIHYCMGAPLSRIEAAVALESVLDRLPNLRLTGEPTEISAHVLHGVDTLPVAWDVP
jgi:cytochrome P450